MCKNSNRVAHGIGKIKELPVSGCLYLQMGFVCGTCGEIFPMSEGLEKHCRANHGGRTPFKCYKCSKSFRYWLGKQGLKAHLGTHESCQDKNISAVGCSSENLGAENFIVEADPLSIEEFNDLEFCELVCGDCGIQYSSLVSYEAHCKSHDSKEPFKCIECSLKFKKHAHLEEHRASHLLVKLYSCEECGKEYSFQWSLFMHSKEHGVRPALQCKKCGLEFFNANFLTSHEHLHDLLGGSLDVDSESASVVNVGLQPCKFHVSQVQPCPICDDDKTISLSELECGNCELEFATKDDLCRHLDLHKNPQTFKCEECNKVFGSFIGLREHVYGSHSDMEVHWCEDCGGSGYTNMSLSPESSWSRMEDNDGWSSSAENVDTIEHTVKEDCDTSSSMDELSEENTSVMRQEKKDSNKAGPTIKQRGSKQKQRKQAVPEKNKAKNRGVFKGHSDVKLEKVVKVKKDCGPKSKRGTRHSSSKGT